MTVSRTAAYLQPARPVWLKAACLLALLLLVTPYAGLRHDAVLYLGQLLYRLDPASLGADIFFAHGSQDRYSLYSNLLAPLLTWLPLTVLQTSFLVLAQLASYAALYRLLKPIGNDAERWLGLAFVACLSHRYGGQGIFAFAENFLTARSLAEPLVLWGLALQLERRSWLSAVLLVGAALMHPIMVLPALLVSWLLLLQRDRRYAWALLLLPVPLLLAVLGLAPFDSLARRYDEAWWQLVKEVNSQVLLQSWSWPDWQGVAVDLLTLLAVWRALPKPLARLGVSALVAALLLLLASWLGADLGRNILLTQLQLWRVLWLAHALALCSAPALIGLAWSQGGVGRLLALSIVALLLAVAARFDFSWVLLLWVGLWLALLLARLRVSRLLLVLSAGATVLAVLMLAVSRLANEGLALRLGYADAAVLPMWQQLLGLPVVALGLGCAAWLLWVRARWASMALCALLFSAAFIGADGRSDWGRLIDDGLGREHPFAALIPAGSQVYWHGEFAATWVLLRRPSYYDKAQGAGLLFNQGTAEEFAPRWTAWQPVRDQVLGCRFSAVLGHHSPSECITPAQEELARLCRSQTKLDYLIIERALSLPPLASWNPHLSSHPAQTFHLYACQQLR